MAEQATTSERPERPDTTEHTEELAIQLPEAKSENSGAGEVPQGAARKRAPKAATRKPTKKAKDQAESGADVSGAVAASLAALEAEASKRTDTPKTSAGSPENLVDDLMQAIEIKEADHVPTKARSKSSATGSDVHAKEGKKSPAKARKPKKASEDSSQTGNPSVSEEATAIGQVAPKKTAKKSTPKKSPAKKSPAKKKVASTTVAEASASDSASNGVTLSSTFSSEDVPAQVATPFAPAMTALLFQEPDVARARTRRRKGSSTPVVEPPAQEVEVPEETPEEDTSENEGNTSTDTPRRKRGSRGRRKSSENSSEQSASAASADEAPAQAEEEAPSDTETPEATTTTRRRRRRRSSTNGTDSSDEVTAPKGSTRLEAKRQRRKEGREAGRRRHTVTESEYLARRESVKRDMLVREQDGLNQIAVLEDDVLVEHYVARHTQVSMVGNVYLGRVQNVLPSMEAAFVDIGKGRNAVLYAGEVNWEAAGLEGKPRRIEQALKSGDTVLVQVTKDPIGHKGARLTAQITLAGRHLVLVPSGAMTGISRKLPDKERQRLKRLLREIVPPEHGVIVRTAAEGASEEQLRADVERLTKAWSDIQEKAKAYKSAPTLLKGEPELAVRVVRDIFNEDFNSLKVQGNGAWKTLSDYVGELSPELSSRLSHWTSDRDIFAEHRVDEQLAKAFDRKVWLPSGGTLVIDRTEAMTVIDVNTGKFTGAGGTLEETVTRNNLEAAEEIVRQLRLRDIGGIIVVDFIDMVLESNRDLVLRRLIECLGRDRTRHQVAEVTSLGLVQMTRKRVGQGLVEAFSTPCEACEGRGYILHSHPVERADGGEVHQRRGKKNAKPVYSAPEQASSSSDEEDKRDGIKAALNSIAAAAGKVHESGTEDDKPQARERKTGKGSRKGRERGSKGSQSQQDSTPSSEPRDSGSDNSSASVSDRSESKKNSKDVVKTSHRGKALTTASVPDSSKEVTTAKPAALRKAASLPVGKVGPSTTESGEQASADASEKSGRKPRRAASSGTITPGSGATGAILSFPAN